VRIAAGADKTIGDETIAVAASGADKTFAVTALGADKTFAVAALGADKSEQLEDHYDSMVDLNLYDADNADRSN
jgi:hypothetical protein